jgi:hypothetical protein
MPWDHSISYSLPRSELLLDSRESARNGCIFCSIMMDGLDQVQKVSWYREDLELSDEATLEVVNTTPLHVELKDSKGRDSRAVRSLYFYAAIGQYTVLSPRSMS